MKAIITGGGTGGHIYPALAIADELKKKGWEILYLGSKHRMEAEIVPQKGYQFQGLTSRQLPRRISWQIFSAFFYNLKAFINALKIIYNFKADLVIGTGGFAAGPVVMAAVLLGRKTIIHEQNAYPGITNKLLALFVDYVFLNFSEAEKHLKAKKAKIKLTGNPVRKEIIAAEPENAYKFLNLDKNLKTLLITGGSQGAETINKNLIKIYQHAAENNEFQIVHLTGKKNYDQVIRSLKENDIDPDNRLIKVIAYLNEMEYALTAADLVISRAGATALSEITLCGIPSILIPLASAAEGHQLYNAKTLENKGAAIIIREEELAEQILLEKILTLFNDQSKLEKMSKAAKSLANEDSLKKIITLIDNIVTKD